MQEEFQAWSAEAKTDAGVFKENSAHSVSRRLVFLGTTDVFSRSNLLIGGIKLRRV